MTAHRTADALLSPPLEGLVRDVRGVVARHLPARRTAEAVAALLRPVLGVPGLLTRSTAISLHVCGADVRALGSSIRRTYDHGA